MPAATVFISYSHADEWLRSELVTHLSALKRNGTISVWHDRLIPPGGLIDAAVDVQVQTADIFLFLVSPDFIASEYCFHKEYQRALERFDQGDVAIVPIIVRDCDWDVGRLRSFKAMPNDGRPVTRDAVSRVDVQQRDKSWAEVVTGIKTVIGDLKKKRSPPDLAEAYQTSRFIVSAVKHPLLAQLDERDVFVDPNIYHENTANHIANFRAFAEQISQQKAAVVAGRDSSGKTLIAKMLQDQLCRLERPAVILQGDRLKNADIARHIRNAISVQYNISDFPDSKFSVIIDNFDECQLPDTVKEHIVRHCATNHPLFVLFSYSPAPSVLFTPDDLPDPHIYQINPFGDEKLLDLVSKWKALGRAKDYQPPDAIVLPTYSTLHQLFTQVRIDKYPATAITFLQFIETVGGSDIAASSFAACYDAMVGTKISLSASGWRALDEAKNFLSLVAYAANVETAEPRLSRGRFEECLAEYQEQYLSDVSALEKLAFDEFLVADGDYVRFHEEYMWYFLCARYVARTLSRNDSIKYLDFIELCTRNIFLRKYANMIVFISYFSDDNAVLTSLLVVIDGLFSKADGWILSDASKPIMLGLTANDPLVIESSPDVSDNRREILRQRVVNIVDDAEGVVARFTLPFLDSEIEDSEYIEQIDVHVLDSDSYMRSTNALMRIHSVIGQILASRPGTFETKNLLECISKMVKASGRYIALNHAIAAVLVLDKQGSLDEVDRAVDNTSLSAEAKLEKVERIFSFWSVYISQAGLARYLNNDHSIRGLKLLVGQNENKSHADAAGNIPFNFTSVLMIAELYKNGNIDREAIEGILAKYGENSALVSLMRVVVHIYSYYMPMKIEDKQWIAAKLKMSLRYLEAQRLKALGSGRGSRA